MADVFGGLTGDPDGPGDDDGAGGDRGRKLAALERVLDGAVLWGLELEPRFRVLAATVEPRPDRYPWGALDDRRIQLLCFPVSTILASLRQQGEPELLSFTEEQLVDVVAALGGAPLQTPLFSRPEPRPGEWGPRFSLEGRSTAPDGRRSTITVSAREDGLSLDLFARFDDLELRGPAGDQLPWP